MLDQDRVGVSVFSSKHYHYLRFHLRKPLLKRIGNPRRIGIRGQPANGFILTPDADHGLKTQVAGRPDQTDMIYLQTTLSRFELSRRVRRPIYVRPEFQNGALRVPALPQAWIDAADEMCEVPRDPVVLPRNPLLGNGHVNGGSPTSPIPKTQVLHLDAHPEMAALQHDLAVKIEEARTIIKEIETRTGLKLALDKNLRGVVLVLPNTH